MPQVSRGRSEFWEHPKIVAALRAERRRLAVRAQAIRNGLGLTQEQAAEAAALTVRAIAKLEGGKLGTSTTTLIVLAFGYKIAVRDFFD